MKSKKIGMQALKIAIGSSLAIYIANLFGLKYSLAAGSVALLTMVTTKWKTVKLSVARVVTFIISVLMALIIFSAVESEWMAYGIYVFFVVIIAEMLGWGATISVNALIGMHFLEIRDFPETIFLFKSITQKQPGQGRTLLVFRQFKMLNIFPACNRH